MLLLADRQSRIIGRAVRADVLFELRQSALCLIERKNVFLPVDRAQYFILANFEFRFANSVFCFQERGLVLRRLDCRIRLGFDDFLVGLFKVAAVLRQIVFLLARVKLQYNVACMHMRSSGSQLNDLQGASGDWRRRKASRLLRM